MDIRWRLTAAALLVIPFLWSYWPTLVELVSVWNREPDYSHGFLVAPLAILLLYMRRDDLPDLSQKIRWEGIVLIAMSMFLRWFGAYLFLSPVDGWSMLLWIAGVVWLFCGWHILRWSAPAIAFLIFMVPMPHRIETELSYPLQRVATKLSVFSLQSLGQPAISEGNVILINDVSLEVAQACSGLRIFMGVITIACAFVIVTKGAWWEKVILLLSVIPIALIVNAARIVSTGILYQWFVYEGAHKVIHDAAGWVMIPLAAAMFGMVLWYLRRLLPLVEQVEIRAVLRWQQA